MNNNVTSRPSQIPRDLPNLPTTFQLPDTSRRSNRWRRRWLGYAMLSCGPLGLLVALASGSTDADSTTTLTGDRAHEAVAAVVVDDVLAGAAEFSIPTAAALTRPITDQANPHGAVDAKLVRPLPHHDCATTATSNDDTSHHCELYRFLVVTVTNTTLVITVPIISTPTGPVLAADPHLAPYTDEGDLTVTLGLGDGLDRWAPTDGANQQITRWLEAYLTDDRATLYDLTGDTQARAYHGLQGFTRSDSLRATSTARNANNAWVRIEFTVTDATQGTPIPLSMDLMLAGLDNRLPNIVAWGPAGAGTTLEPFSNGIATSDLTDLEATN